MSNEERKDEHRSLMADLRAAVNAHHPEPVEAEYANDCCRFIAAHGPRLLALLEAGRACRDELGADCEDPNCGWPTCVLVRRYDEAAK